MIPQGHLLEQDKVFVLDHGPKDARHKHPVKHLMHAVDAKHAVSTEPSRWTWVGEEPAGAAAAKIGPKPAEEPAPEAVEDVVNRKKTD